MYARRQNARTLTFIVSGMLWRNSLVMRDLETGSDWSHITGACRRGSLEGALLERVPSVQTTWREWRAAHPGTKLLVKARDVRSSHYADYFADPDRNGLFRTDWLREQLSGKTLVYGVTRGPHALAVTGEAVDREGAIEHELAGENVFVTRGADRGVRAYLLVSEPADTTRARRGDEIAIGRFFWFAWSSFYPNTVLVR